MTFAETMAMIQKNIQAKEITVWNKTAICATAKAWANTEKYLQNYNLAERLSAAISRAMRKMEVNTPVPFKMPYHLWRLEPQLKDCKEFWRKKGVKFRTEKAHLGKPHTIWFVITMPLAPELFDEIESDDHELDNDDFGKFNNPDNEFFK